MLTFIHIQSGLFICKVTALFNISCFKATKYENYETFSPSCTVSEVSKREYLMTKNGVR